MIKVKASDRVQIVLESDHRHSLNDVFALARKEPAGTICCVCNADCHFNETLDNVRRRDLHGKFLCLTRHETNGHLIPNAWGSQDAWIWLAEETPEDFEPLEFGRGAVDHKIVFNLLKRKIKPENPCNSIYVRHLHANNQANSPARFPSYTHPFGWVYPEDAHGHSETFVSDKPGVWPAGESRPRYPMQRQGRGPNGQLFVETLGDRGWADEATESQNIVTGQPVRRVIKQRIRYPGQSKSPL